MPSPISEKSAVGDRRYAITLTSLITRDIITPVGVRLKNDSDMRCRLLVEVGADVERDLLPDVGAQIVVAEAGDARAHKQRDQDSSEQDLQRRGILDAAQI